jgi:gp16 family phage-associated protein
MIPRKLKVPQDVKNEWQFTGVTMADWARRNGFCKATVSQVLNGKNAASRGVGHRIAVMLRIKDGAIGGQVRT